MITPYIIVLIQSKDYGELTETFADCVNGILNEELDPAKKVELLETARAVFVACDQRIVDALK